MSDRQELYDELLPLLDQPSADPIRDRPGADRDGRVWSFCPAHPDGQKSHRRSLSLSPRYGLDCFAGCDFQTIVRTLRDRSGRVTPIRPRDAHNSGMRQPVTARNASQHSGKLTAEYVYRTPDGEVVAVKGRFELPNGEKSFSWRLPASDSWTAGLGGMRMADIPLYNAEKIAALPDGATVWITEGEKDLGALEARVDPASEAVTTHPGGASTKDFGNWPARLFAGRKFHFRTWADNDDVGREFMGRWRQVIAPYAASVSAVNVNVGHKEGAWDFFSKHGGTIEAVRESRPTKPIVQYGSGGSIRVSVPAGDGPIVHFTFAQIEKSTRSLDSEMQVEIEAAGQTVDDVPFSQRINVLSGSQITDLRRTLETIFGKSYEWAKVLNKAVNLMRQAFAQVDRSRDACEAEEMPFERGWFIDGYIPAASLIGVFGDGESAKTMTMIRAALSASLGEDFLPGIPALQGVGLYGDWETNFEDWGRRVRRVVRGMGYPQMPPGLLHYWPGAASGTPIFDQIDAIVEACLRYQATYFICDSLGFACGTEPERAESAIKTYNALNRLVDLGITVIGLGHINRSDAEKAGRGGALRMYGNIFWTNGPRHTLFVKRSTGDNEDTIYQGWFPRKWNNGRRPQMLTIKVDFEGEHGPITFVRQEQKVPDLETVRGLRARLWELLKDEPKPIAALSEELEGAEAAEIEKALKGARIGATKAKAFTSFDRDGEVVWARAVGK